MKRFLCHVGFQPGYFLEMLGSPPDCGVIIDPSHINADKASEIAEVISERLVDPKTYHLAFPAESHSNPIQAYLGSFSVARSDLVHSSAKIQLSTIVTEAVSVQRSLQCSAVISPYFFADSVTDPWLEISLHSAIMTQDRIGNDMPTYCGLYISDAIIRDPSQLENLLSRVTQADVAGFYILVDQVIPGSEIISDLATLVSLRKMFNVLERNGYDTILGHCSLEGVVLLGTSGLSGFGSDKRFATRRRSVEDLRSPASGFRRSPALHVLVKPLIADVHIDEFRQLIALGFALNCGCAACLQLIPNHAGTNPSKLASQHYVRCLSGICRTLDGLSPSDRKVYIKGLLTRAIANLASLRPRIALDLRRFTHLRPLLTYVQT